jgi:hypothetical protein
MSAGMQVRVANMHGAAAERLRAIRAQFFPNGELEDGGGAVLPAAAGAVGLLLAPSQHWHQPSTTSARVQPIPQQGAPSGC